MDTARLFSLLGAGTCLLVVLVLAVPGLVISGAETLLWDYYTAGPTGGLGIGFFALIGVVVFLSGEHGRADPPLVAGIALAIGVAIVVLSGIWLISISQTLVFSFPVRYEWIQYHRYVVFGISIVVLLAAGWYAREYI